MTELLPYNEISERNKAHSSGAISAIVVCASLTQLVWQKHLVLMARWWVNSTSCLLMRISSCAAQSLKKHFHNSQPRMCWSFFCAQHTKAALSIFRMSSLRAPVTFLQQIKLRQVDCVRQYKATENSAESREYQKYHRWNFKANRAALEFNFES